MTLIEIVLGCITAITVTSLTLSYKWIKIQRKWKIEDSLPPAPPKPPPPPPKLNPFLEIKDGCQPKRLLLLKKVAAGLEPYHLSKDRTLPMLVATLLVLLEVQVWNTYIPVVYHAN